MYAFLKLLEIAAPFVCLSLCKFDCPNYFYEKSDKTNHAYSFVFTLLFYNSLIL